MSFISLEFMRIQSPEIMADCTEAKQVLLARHQASNRQMTLRNAEWGPVYLRAVFLCHCGHIWKKCCNLGQGGEEQEGSRDDSFCKNGYLSWSSAALSHT